ITTGPLSILQITRQYRDIFDIDEDKAKELANLTKGYAFAFQALGVCYWDNRDKGNDVVIEKYEELLDDFVYKKIWSSLTGKEREIVSAISDNEEKVGDICKRIKMSNGTFSKYKETLIAKGVLESRQYGSVSFALPRFHEVVRNYD
nr:transcriptional regulator [Lachnospiraceae bacterium]